MTNAVADTETCLANIERHNTDTNAYVTVIADQVLEQPAAIDAAAGWCQPNANFPHEC